MSRKQMWLYLVLAVTLAGIVAVGALTRDFSAILGASGIGTALIGLVGAELRAEGDAARKRQERIEQAQRDAERARQQQAQNEAAARETARHVLEEMGMKRIRELEDESDRSRKDRDRLQQEIQRLTEANQAHDDRTERQQTRIDQFETALTMKSEQIASLTEQIEQRAAEIEALTSKIAALEAQIDKLEAANLELKERDQMKQEEIGRLTEALEAAKQALRDKESELERDVRERDDALKRLHELEEEIAVKSEPAPVVQVPIEPDPSGDGKKQ